MNGVGQDASGAGQAASDVGQAASDVGQDASGAGQAASGVGQATIKRVALLTNPAAGKGSAADAALAATQQLNSHGIDVVHLQGPDAASSRKLAKAAIDDERVDALVVCGGDGLINLALQEQANSGIPLGIIPAGTGNDHAREYNIPLDPRRAADVIAQGFWTTTDLGLMRAVDAAGDGSAGDSSAGDGSAGDGDAWAVDDAGDGGAGEGASGEKGNGQPEQMWFGTIACAGFDSLVSDRTNRMTWPKGRNRYNLAIVAEFLNFRALPTRLVLEPGSSQERVIEQPMVLCAIGNTKSYGGGMKICPEANHHDGLFDVTVMGDVSRARAAVKFGKILKGTIADEAGIDFYRAKRVLIHMVDPARAGGAGAGGVGAGAAGGGAAVGAGGGAGGGAAGGVGAGGGAAVGVDASGAPITGYADGDPFGPLPMVVEVVPGAGKYLVPRP